MDLGLEALGLLRFWFKIVRGFGRLQGVPRSHGLGFRVFKVAWGLGLLGLRSIYLEEQFPHNTLRAPSTKSFGVQV